MNLRKASFWPKTERIHRDGKWDGSLVVGPFDCGTCTLRVIHGRDTGAFRLTHYRQLPQLEESPAVLYTHRAIRPRRPIKTLSAGTRQSYVEFVALAGMAALGLSWTAHSN